MDIWRDKHQEKWDLIFSADWVTAAGVQKEKEYIYGKLLEEIKGEELSAIIELLIFVKPDDVFVKRVVRAVKSSENNREAIFHGGIYSDKQYGIGEAYVFAPKLESSQLAK